MAWQVIEYMEENPQASLKTVIGHFAEMLEVDKYLQSIKKEVDGVLLIREQLKPLYGKKMNAEQRMVALNSDFDMDVMIKYPPRKGTEKERKAEKLKLQMEHSEYQQLSQEVEEAKEKISELEEQMHDLQQSAKNGRRILETFNNYAAFIFQVYSNPAVKQVEEQESNLNIF